jgi:hypothetical protein
MDDNGQLVTSNSDISRVIAHANDLITKGNIDEFKLQHQKDQLSAALETEEHRGCTQAISSIASWKKGFVEDIHMYKKHGRHDIDANNEVQFATLFYNFMRKHPNIVISQVSVPQINLDISTAPPPVVPALSNGGSAPDQQMYHVNDINELNPCTLLYVKGSMLKTIEVVDAILMATHIMHGRPVPSECAVVEVTTIRESCEFEDLDYLDEEEIEKLKAAKWNFILSPCKDIIMKTCSSLIVSPWSRVDEGTPTSQNTICSTTAFTPPSQNPLKTTPPAENPPSTQPHEHHSHHTTPLQDPPTEQVPQQCFSSHIHSLKSPHTTPPLQNSPTEQAPQQCSPPHVNSLKSPHTTPPLQNPPTKQAPQ